MLFASRVLLGAPIVQAIMPASIVEGILIAFHQVYGVQLPARAVHVYTFFDSNETLVGIEREMVKKRSQVAQPILFVLNKSVEISLAISPSWVLRASIASVKP